MTQYKDIKLAEEIKKKTTNELLEEISKKIDMIIDKSKVMICVNCGETYKDYHICSGHGFRGSSGAYFN